MNVDAMLRSITAKQFTQLVAYYSLEPFGQGLEEVRSSKADYRTASLRETMYNLAVKKEYQKPLDHFLLKWKEKKGDTEEPPQTGQTWQQKKQIAYTIALAYAAKAKDV